MIIYWIDIATMIIFTLEAIAKIITYGFILNGETSYIRRVWNMLDFTILIFSYLCLTPLVSTFKVVKTLRILRSLRLIGRNEGLRVAVRALFFAIPNVINITVIMIIFFMIFAVIIVSYFKGKLYYCLSQDVGPNMPEMHTKWDCLDSGGLWVNRVLNFDNMPNALVTLFVMSTTAGWGEVMYYTIEGRGIDQMPDEHHKNPVWIVFFIIFMIVGCFFFLNLFVGVVINTFKSESDRVGGSELLTEKQKEWIDLRLLVLRSAPIKKVQPPPGTIRRFLFNLYLHKYFERVI
jgi:Ion transport protein